MIKLGVMQELEVSNIGPIGAMLVAEDDRREYVILPSEMVPNGIEIGEGIEVFIYRDTEDELTATTEKPKLELGELAYLRVASVTKFGAFLEWGLKKDLFLPYKEQNDKLTNGDMCLVGLYVDKSNRLCATMYISKVLRSDSPYIKNDKAEGIIYEINPDMGAFVAVDKKFHGLIPKSEMHKDYAVGDLVDVRVINVREDGKLDLSTREKAYLQMDADAEAILAKLEILDGVMYLNDDSSPDDIKLQLGISKKAFKRAVGTLLKSGKIEFIDGGIKLC